MFVLDAGYDPAGLSYGLRHPGPGARPATKRPSFSPSLPKMPARRAAQGPHGRRFKLSDHETVLPPTPRCAWKTAATARSASVPGTTCTRCMPGDAGPGGLPPIVRGSVIRVDVERLPKPSSRANNKLLWLWWSGPGEPDLELCLHAYLHRFDLEHTYRFVKNTLGWTTPSLLGLEQADRWTWLTVAAYAQLRIARGIVADLRLPWGTAERARKLTPARVRRGVPLRVAIGTPANPPKSQKAGPDGPRVPADRPEPATRSSRRPPKHPNEGLSASLGGRQCNHKGMTDLDINELGPVDYLVVEFPPGAL